MTEIILYFYKILKVSTIRFINENYSLDASALTFLTLLAIVPFFSISLFILTLFPDASRYTLLFDDYILQNLIPSSATMLRIYLNDFLHHTAGLSIFSIIFLMVSALLMIDTTEDVINKIWQIRIRPNRFFIMFFNLIILLLMPILFGISLFITSYIFTTYFISVFNSFFIFVSPIIINCIILSAFYIYVPHTRVNTLDGLIGGLLAAILIEFAKIFFALWISHFSNYELIYGVFATLPIFLLWIYICWMIILWGAIITHTASKRHARTRSAAHK